MKKALQYIAKMLATDGKVSSKRVYSGLLIVTGIILAFAHGNPGNVQTLIYGGCALLGVGAFAERIGVGRDI